MQMLRNVVYTVIIAVWVLLATIVLGCTIIVMAFLIQKPNWFHQIARLWAKSILWVSWVKVEVKGLENLPKDGPCILMPIHQSNFDIPVLLGRLPVQFRWLAKAELFRIPIFGRGMRGCGYISIDRSNRKSAFRSLADAAQKIRNGTSVLIFPEGTRSRDGKIRPFKKGGFVMAIDSGVPIVPVVITGTRSIMPKGRFRVYPGHVSMVIHKPIETSIYTPETKDGLMEKVRRVICDNFENSKMDEGVC